MCVRVSQENVEEREIAGEGCEERLLLRPDASGPIGRGMQMQQPLPESLPLYARQCATLLPAHTRPNSERAGDKTNMAGCAPEGV